jgi:hypothetical protein
MKTQLCAWILLAAAVVAQAQNDNSITISGRVVDDATSQPIIDFVVQRGSTNFTSSGEIFWQHYMMGDPRTPGVWSGKMENQDQAVRILAPGYIPEILKIESFTNGQNSGLEVRLKHGAVVQGVVLDADGQPVVGAKVYLATVQRVYLMDGKSEYGEFRGDSTTTDGAGRFALHGEGRTSQKVVIASADNQLVWPVVQSDPKQELTITLSKPGTLIVRYDIPGDTMEAKPELRLMNTNRDETLWKDISFGFSFTVTNGGQIVLTNLTPGTYNFRRYKTDGAHGAENEQQTVVVEAGKTQYADMVRTNGQHIRGKVLGLDVAKASGGYIFVKSAEATGLPWPQRSRNEQNEFKYRTFDVSQFGADGTFQTAMLAPGTYTVAADVYPPKGSSPPYRNDNPDYVAVAKVTVTTNAMPPVTLKLAQAQYVDVAGTVVDDKTGTPIPTTIQSGKVNPDKPDEIIWSPGYMVPGTPGQFSLWDLTKDSAFRVLANGYLPQAFRRNNIIASRHTANLQIRLQRGATIRGLVLDHAGQPVAHAKVILAPLDLGEMPQKPILWGSLAGEGYTFATTDHAGHFSIGGVGENPRIIVVTDDGQMVQPVQTKLSDADLKITLPKPATLIVHYDIPGDQPKADIGLTLHTNELEMPLWKDIVSDVWTNVPNAGQIIFTNLAPGTYNFSRTKTGGTTNCGYAFIFGNPLKVVQFNPQTILLKPGQTQQVNMVRSTGQRVQGRVTGMRSITNTAGAFLYVASANAIRNPNDFKTNNLEPCYDAVFLDTNELFQTALLEPGTYTLVAEVYVWDKFKPHEYADYEPQYGGILWSNPQQLAYVGSAIVTITANAMPPVKIELHP